MSSRVFQSGWFDGRLPESMEWVEDDPYARRFGPFRWRGHLNLKDIVERAIGGSVAGVFAGLTLWILTRLAG